MEDLDSILSQVSMLSKNMKNIKIQAYSKCIAKGGKISLHYCHAYTHLEMHLLYAYNSGDYMLAISLAKLCTLEPLFRIVTVLRFDLSLSAFSFDYFCFFYCLFMRTLKVKKSNIPVMVILIWLFNNWSFIFHEA